MRKQKARRYGGLSGIMEHEMVRNLWYPLPKSLLWECGNN